MRPMTDLEPVTEVNDMEESSVDAATSMKVLTERDEKETVENRIEKRPRAQTFCKSLKKKIHVADLLSKRCGIILSDFFFTSS